MIYEIDVRYSTRTERDERVLKVAESFGLGLEDRDWVIFDKFQVEVKPGDVVYINGQSGSGKSSLLRELAGCEADNGMSVANLDDVQFEDKPVISQIGRTMEEATKLLALAGLSDAYLYVRKPKELSDGQKYRFRLAKLLESNADTWIADEFGAVLDRVTAQVVANNIARTARQFGKTLIVATTHTDLVEAMGPSLLIQKRFGDKIEVSRHDPQ
jgi:ABC-type ATPase with predicted acetyltransferase domain